MIIKVYPAAIVLFNQAGTYLIVRRPLSVPFLNRTSGSAIVRTVSKFPQNRKCLWQQRRWKRLFDFFKLVPATIQYTVLKDKASCIVARRLSNGAGGWVKPKGGLRSSTHWITTPPSASLTKGNHWSIFFFLFCLRLLSSPSNLQPRHLRDLAFVWNLYEIQLYLWWLLQ